MSLLAGEGIVANSNEKNADNAFKLEQVFFFYLQLLGTGHAQHTGNNRDEHSYTTHAAIRKLFPSTLWDTGFSVKGELHVQIMGD